jgi:FKBP-type peptidyl-prolyl cis-trans isomerase
MATQISQRIGIWIIAIVLTVGTLGSFLVMALSVQNESTDQSRIQTEYTEYQAAVSAQTKELSDKYFAGFNKYSSMPKAFSAGDVTKLIKKDLKVGNGEVVTATTEYNAYYIGWNPKGVVFDQSISDGKLIAPIAGGNLITGWNEGVIGMKIGGVRELSIPSDKAYGSTGSGDNIPPNTPIKFIVMIIPKVEDVPVPAELLKYYQSQSISS